jgi:hypothetical protein
LKNKKKNLAKPKLAKIVPLGSTDAAEARPTFSYLDLEKQEEVDDDDDLDDMGSWNEADAGAGAGAEQSIEYY